MKAGLRFTTILLAAGLGLGPVTALAQSTTEPPPATSNTTATDAVGPRELQNFSLPGTTTRPAEQPPQAPPTSAPKADTPPGATAPKTGGRTEAQRNTAQTAASGTLPARPTQAPPAAVQPDSLTPAPATRTSATPVPQPSFGPALAPQSAEPAPVLPPEPGHRVSLLPWLLAGLALAGGGAFLLWRRRPREVFAGGPQIDLFKAPEPAPAPRPQPTPRPAPPVAEPKPAPATSRPAAPAAASGIVTSRLRPSIEIGMQPLRCIVADDQVTLEFEIDLFNAGTAPARAVLAEASMLNAGGTQEQELSAFFSNPVGAGQRIDAIPPLKRITLTSQVVAPRAAIQEYELAGRKAFVPVIAFNALYEWSGGQGQTSAAYLVGRETGSDKLGPMHLDQGAREFRAVGARPLPTALRT